MIRLIKPLYCFDFVSLFLLFKTLLIKPGSHVLWTYVAMIRLFHFINLNIINILVKIYFNLTTVKIMQWVTTFYLLRFSLFLWLDLSSYLYVKLYYCGPFQHVCITRKVKKWMKPLAFFLIKKYQSLTGTLHKRP